MDSGNRLIKALGGSLCLLISGCVSHPSDATVLEQAPPRAVSKSLRIPENASLGPVIPGLRQGAVPQGMSFLPEKEFLLTSHYSDSDHASRIVSIDWKTGDALHTTKLLEPDGSPHTGHVGGIIAESSNLWIASDAYLYQYMLDDFFTHTQAIASARFSTEATHAVAFCTAYDGKIWAGEFALADKYPTHPSHHLTARDGTARRGWICGYSRSSGFSNPPEKVLSIPDRTQGIVMTDDWIYLSLSYGRRNRSSIEIFKNPLAETPHRHVQTSKGNEVPLWFLDGTNHVRSIDLPPMAENIQLIDGQLAVLFESGASKFKRLGKKPLDHILLLNLEGLIP